ncbi:MAG TPA: hemerythrin domain-containing protein [bacterium]|nr:hemerythrin domain-containing protein [bacterium]
MIQNTFFSLEAYHHDLEDLFARHQAAVVEKHFAEAFTLLKHYRSALECHAQEEEQELFPILHAFAGVPPGGSVEQFKAEHKKLFELFDAVEKRFQEAAANASPAPLIALIEEEARYKGLYEHHVMREHNVLFPMLDRVLGDTERARVLANCTMRVADTGESLVPRPKGHDAIVLAK